MGLLTNCNDDKLQWRQVKMLTSDNIDKWQCSQMTVLTNDNVDKWEYWKVSIDKCHLMRFNKVAISIAISQCLHSKDL